MKQAVQQEAETEIALAWEEPFFLPSAGINKPINIKVKYEPKWPSLKIIKERVRGG